MLKWRAGGQHGLRCTATQGEVDDTTIEFCPADLTETLRGGLGEQPDRLELRRYGRAAGVRSPGSFRESKRDEIQLVMRQGPACLAIASYSVKR